VVGVSGANEYRVKPLLLVSTITPAIVAVFTVPAATAAGLLLEDTGEDTGEDEGEEAPDELHATSATAAAAAAGSARSIRRRARPLIRYALPRRPGIFRVVMTSCPSGNRYWHQKANTQASLILRNMAADYRPPNV
jgi:hypothetical protein